MSVQQALRFIQQIRQDETLKEKLGALGVDVEIERVVDLAQSAGWLCTAEELRTAFKYDWTMRWFHFSAASHAVAKESLEEHGQ